MNPYQQGQMTNYPASRQTPNSIHTFPNSTPNRQTPGNIEGLFFGVVCILLVFSAIAVFISELIAKALFLSLVVGAVLFVLGSLFLKLAAIWQGIETKKENLKTNAKRYDRESQYLVVAGKGYHVIFDRDKGKGEQFQRIPNPRPMMPETQDVEIVENATATINALTIGVQIDRGIIAGGTRSGKTFYAKNLAVAKMERGHKIFALDPKHRKSPYWPNGVRVVGSGYNYDEMAEFWKWLESERERRGQYFEDVDKFPEITIFFDEVPDTLAERPEFSDNYLSVLRTYAEYRIYIWVIGQSDDKDSLGLKKAQFKNSFDLTLLFKKDFNGNRLSYVNEKPIYTSNPDNSELLEPYPVVLKRQPSPSKSYSRNACHSRQTPQDNHERPVYRSGTYSENPRQTPGYKALTGGRGENYVNTPRQAPRYFESRLEYEIVNGYENGMSLSKLAKHHFGYSNGETIKKVKAVLNNYSISL